MLPMPNLFNHVIVEFSLEGKTMWVDVTMKRQGGGALNRAIENFGAGLPVDSTTTSGIVEAPPNAGGSVYEIKESILLDTSGKPSFLAVNVRATGRFADALRRQIAVDPIEKLQNEKLQECGTRFGNVQRSERLQHQDDRASNQFLLAEAFEIDGFLAPHPDPGFCTFHSPPSALFSALQVPGPEPRNAPFALSYPSQIVHTLEVETPTLQPMAVPNFYRETAFIRFSRREKTYRGKWSMTLTFTTLGDSVPASSLQDYRATLQEIWGQSGCSLFFPTGYRHPRKRSDFGKLPNSVPAPAPVEPISFTRSTSPLFPEKDRPVCWPGDKPPREPRSKRSRRRGLQRKDWLWLTLAVTLALLSSLLLYIAMPKGLRKGSGRQTPEHTNSPVAGGKDNQ